MTGGAFGATVLGQGDLVLVIQMQGATTNIVASGAAFQFSFPVEYSSDWSNSGALPLYGSVTSLQNAGNFEYAEVLSVTGTNSVTFNCALTKAYTAAGKVQIVRIPRYNNLTLNAAGKIDATPWNGTIGGIVALEVLGNLTMTAGSRISASAFGFRGGSVNLSSTSSPNNNGVGSTTYYGTSLVGYGGKGEGIGGNSADYALLFATNGRGAIANGGGGGSAHNAGGGGGSNVGSLAWTGKGNPTGYALNYNLESPGFATSTSSGGGRGGYSLATSNADENTVGPANSAWGSDNRRVEGGLGGHTLAYATDRVYLGGGGGAADANNNSTSTVSAGNGGRGGGIVLLTVFGNITGTGTIEANGANGSNCQGATASFLNPKTGADGAGGAGSGGSIIFTNSSAVPNTITVNTNGGNGGSQFFSQFGATIEAAGPGGGGGGGLIALNSGTPIQNALGGINGVTNSSHVSNFPPNGATTGGAGLTNQIISNAYNLTAANATICQGLSTTLTAVLTGTAPAGSTLGWYTQAFGGIAVGTGFTYTTPVLNATTTYYVGYCPGNFRIPVVVTVNSFPIVSGVPTITNVSCSGVLGSITGISVSGGVAPYSYQWSNGGGTALSIVAGAAGAYSLIVSSAGGCAAPAVGPYTIGQNSIPVIDQSALLITNQDCLGTVGSITGITATGNGLIYTWDGVSSATLNLSPATVGSHNLVVTSIDGCAVSAGPFSISAIGGPAINASAVASSNVLCNGTLGTITGITVSGAGLTYSWNGVSSVGPNTSGLSAGSYTLTVTNGIGCSTTAGPYVISTTAGPSIDASLVSVTDVSCTGVLGSISGITSIGNSLTYAWTNTSQTLISPINLVANSYSLTATDALGCTVTSGPFVVGTVPSPTIDASAISITNQNCLGVVGAISGLTATGTGLTYAWDGLNSLTLNLSPASVGSHNLLVTASNGCTASAGPFTIADTPAPTINSGAVVVANQLCNGTLGSITGITATGTGLSYTWNGASSTGINLSSAVAGSYSLIVTNGIGCTASAGPFTISSTIGPVLNAGLVAITNVNCNPNTGAINGITVTSGSGLTYSWTNTAQTTLNLTGLSAGNYTLTATDANGCIASVGPFTVGTVSGININGSGLTVANSACTSNTGAITGLVITGNGPFTYLWNNGATSLDLLNVAAGTYGITITDANGCFGSVTGINVLAANGPTINTTSQVIQSSNCGLPNGSIQNTTVSGGLAPYSYSWNTVPASSNLNLTTVIAGNYTLTVTDANGCIVNGTYTVPSVAGFIIDTNNLVTINSNCDNVAGSISGIVLTGGTGYTYNWTNTAQTTVNPTNLSAGIYDLTVTDASGCIRTINGIEIESNASNIQADFVVTENPGSVNELVQFSDQSTGNISGWNWSIDSTLISVQNPSYIFTEEGIYPVTLIVVNNNGCIDSMTVFVEILTDIVVPNVLTTNFDAINDTWIINGLAKETKVLILNRWGQIVFQTNDYKNDWKGLDSSGEKSVNGVYTYVIITKNGEKISGFLQLISE
jgi:gliding motility-associated-like protein